MFKISNWRHLRISFSFYLMPIFIFSLAFTPNLYPNRLVWVFFVLHLFLYPGSNGYNSYFDKDEGSIGGMKNPPKVSKGLYYLSLVFFLLALVSGLAINWQFSSMLLVYILVSMAYSHPVIRLKKYAYTSWLVAGIFQGYFTFAMAYAGLSDFGWEVFTRPLVLVPGLLTSLMLLGSYPLTQIYQHEEDQKRGDNTLSIRLGIQGTFAFSSMWFLIAGIAFSWFFLGKNQEWALWGFLAAMTPVILYFLIWFFLAKNNPQKYVSYPWAMGMNKMSAIALNIFFAYYFLESTQVLQVF